MRLQTKGDTIKMSRYQMDDFHLSQTFSQIQSHEKHGLAVALAGTQTHFCTARRLMQVWVRVRVSMDIKSITTGTTSKQKQSCADRWLQSKCPWLKRTGEILIIKICPFRKRSYFGLAKEAIYKLTMEQRTSIEMEHLLQI